MDEPSEVERRLERERAVQGSLPLAPIPQAGWLESGLAAMRSYGVRGFAMSVTFVGVVAGTLSAANIMLPLWQYLLSYFILYAIIVLYLANDRPKWRYGAPGILARHRLVDNGTIVRHGLVEGTIGSSVAATAMGRHPDRVYESGCRALLDGPPPLIVCSSGPRDIRNLNEQVFPIFRRQAHERPYTLTPQEHGVPQSISFLRELPDSSEIAHDIAIKDITGLPLLEQAFSPPGSLRHRQPLVTPEHCLDTEMMREHNMIIVGAADSNFWHAALFEMTWQDFHPSTVPLALSMRDGAGATGGRYGSFQIFARLCGLSDSIGLPETRTVSLNERSYPTYAMIEAVTNPLNPDRWCVFISGTRSLGTAGAVWALAGMIEAMVDNPELNFGTYVPTEEQGVRAGVSAVLCRVNRISHSAYLRDGEMVPAGHRAIPLERSDAHYADSYLPAAVQIFTNSDGVGRWVDLCSL